MTVHKLSAGDGYKYYTQSIASGDMERSAKQSLGDYYTVDGNPPGLWEGNGIHLLGLSGQVTEPQMKALYGEGLHPNADQMIADGMSVKETQLGQKMHTYAAYSETVQKAVIKGFTEFERREGKPPTPAQRREIKTAIGGELFRKEHHRDAGDSEELRRWIDTHMNAKQQTVSGYDLVFSPAKSVSVLWATADSETRVKIEKAHTQAISTAMGYLEDKAGYTRKGRNGVRQEKIQDGLIYSRFRHYDSRAGDPQLHDHVVVANRVKATDSHTGHSSWSTLDGRELYQHNVAASELYNSTIMNLLVKDLGVGVTERQVRGSRPVLEIAGVPLDAIEAASSRRGDITAAVDALVEQFEEEHGYSATKKQLIALSQQATLDTRAAKEHRPLSVMLEQWQQELGALKDVSLGEEALAQAVAHRNDWAKEMQENNPLWLLSSPDQIVPELEGTAIIERLGRDQAVWGEHHIESEASRRLTSRLSGQPVPDEIKKAVIEAALQASVRLTPESHQSKIAAHQAKPNSTGVAHGKNRDVYTRAGTELFTSETVLASEASLLGAANMLNTTPVTPEIFATAQAQLEQQTGRLFDAGQLRMAAAFTMNERVLTVGIGPAGTGKTTTQKLVTKAVTASGHQVIGLAPSAAAAKVLGAELSEVAPIQAETIDMFVLAHSIGDEGKYPVKQGDLIIVDEAGMASTPNLAAVVTIARQNGARVAFLGDDAQLAAVGAGGALRLLSQQAETVNLEDLHRFRNLDGTVNEAEAAATLALREPPPAGRVDQPFTYYQDHGRLVGGNTESMTQAAYMGWQKDINSGLDSVMMAYDNATVTGLNARAQAYRAANDQLDTSHGASLSDGLTGHIGDRVVTRENNRRLVLNRGKDFVRNGASWTVMGVHDDGALKVKHRVHGGTITLPAKYVAKHVQLGYAATIHRTQGITADTSHAIFSSAMNRALAYVAASRGKFSNKIYTGLGEGERLSDVLDKIGNDHDRNLTAHEHAANARAQLRSLPERVAAYQDIHHDAIRQRFSITAEKLLGPTAITFTQDKAFGAIAAELHAAERAGINPETLLVAAGKPILGDLATPRAGHDPIEEPVQLLGYRIRDIRKRWSENQNTARPLANISDQHLESLARHAGARALDAGKAVALSKTAPTPKAVVAGLVERFKRKTAHQGGSGGTHWTERMHGHLTDEKLTATLQKAMIKADTAPQDEEGNTTRRKQGWLKRTLIEEKTLRARMDPERRAAEDHERGPATNDPKKPFTQLERAASTIEQRIRAEQIIRARCTNTSKHRDGVEHKDGTPPAWLLPSPTVPGAPALWNEELSTRYEGIKGELLRQGAQLASAPPAWAAALGPVPGSAEAQDRWLTLAAAIDTYRQLNRVSEHETLPIPAKDKSLEAEAMRTEITSMHKYSAQTTTEPATELALQRRAFDEELTTRLTETPTEAELLIHDHRTTRDGSTIEEPALYPDTTGLQPDEPAMTAEDPTEQSTAEPVEDEPEMVDNNKTIRTTEPGEPVNGDRLTVPSAETDPAAMQEDFMNLQYDVDQAAPPAEDPERIATEATQQQQEQPDSPDAATLAKPEPEAEAEELPLYPDTVEVENMSAEEVEVTEQPRYAPLPAAQQREHDLTQQRQNISTEDQRRMKQLLEQLKKKAPKKPVPEEEPTTPGLDFHSPEHNIDNPERGIQR